MAQFTVDDLIKRRIGLQEIRNLTANVGIRQQNADSFTANSVTRRVNSLIKSGDVESAEKLLDNSPSHRAAGIITKIFPKQSVMKITNSKTGETITTAYEDRDPIGTMKKIPAASIGPSQFGEPEVDTRGNLIQTEKRTGKVSVLDRGSAIFSEPFADKRGNLVQRNTQTGEIKVLSRKGQGGGSLEEARQAFLSGNASKEQLALIRQDETEFVKDYVESFGALVGPRRSQELRKQGSLLFEVERLGSNPLPENITSTSAAVEYLVENLKFDEDQAKEIVRQIMRAERAVTE